MPPAALGSTVYSYGNSSLRGGVTKLSPKQGIVVQNQGNGWSHNVVTLTPGIPGDSGSGFLNESGEAIGTLSTLQLAPLAGTNGVGDIAKELAYMRAQQLLLRRAAGARHGAIQTEPGRRDPRLLKRPLGGRARPAGPGGPAVACTSRPFCRRAGCGHSSRGRSQ